MRSMVALVIVLFLFSAWMLRDPATRSRLQMQWINWRKRKKSEKARKDETYWERGM